MISQRPRIVIIGAGFGGLRAASLLARQTVDVLLIDRNNFHTFTPLLYQVATCGLDPSEIAYPVRSIFRKSRNVQFLLGNVTDIDAENRVVHVHAGDSQRSERYDHLIIAAGTVTNYFGNTDLQRLGFGLKDLRDSLQLRDHILRHFEKAAWSKDSLEQQALTTMVVVGGGPTGLETAGAIYELYNHVLAAEYTRINAIHARVILIEATNTLLAPYPERLRESALNQLESLGVEVILGRRVSEIQPDRVILDNGDIIRSHTLIWAAGVKASPIAEMLGVELAQGGRIPVDETMAVKGLPGVYAIGDIAYLTDPQTGQAYAQVIPVAQQQGRLVARNILNTLADRPTEPFVYHDRGIMATIGRRRAVAWPYYKVQLTGFLAWVVWLFLHLLWLMGFRNRLNVMVNWIWNYLTYDRSVRLILDVYKDTGDEHAGHAGEEKTKANIAF